MYFRLAPYFLRHSDLLRTHIGLYIQDGDACLDGRMWGLVSLGCRNQSTLLKIVE